MIIRHMHDIYPIATDMQIKKLLKFNNLMIFQ